MTGYVSKEELKEFFEGIEITVAGRTRAEAISEVLKAVYNGVMKLPTTDAVPVIRCKDCVYCVNEPDNRDGSDVYICQRTPWSRAFGQRGNGFCAWAERKEE